jgi:hypothetical protein
VHQGRPTHGRARDLPPCRAATRCQAEPRLLAVNRPTRRPAPWHRSPPTSPALRRLLLTRAAPESPQAPSTCRGTARWPCGARRRQGVRPAGGQAGRGARGRGAARQRGAQQCAAAEEPGAAVWREGTRGATRGAARHGSGGPRRRPRAPTCGRAAAAQRVRQCSPPPDRVAVGGAQAIIPGGEVTRRGSAPATRARRQAGQPCGRRLGGPCPAAPAGAPSCQPRPLLAAAARAWQGGPPRPSPFWG